MYTLKTWKLSSDSNESVSANEYPRQSQGTPACECVCVRTRGLCCLTPLCIYDERDVFPHEKCNNLRCWQHHLPWPPALSVTPRSALFPFFCGSSFPFCPLGFPDGMSSTSFSILSGPLLTMWLLSALYFIRVKNSLKIEWKSWCWAKAKFNSLDSVVALTSLCLCMCRTWAAVEGRVLQWSSRGVNMEIATAWAW